MKSKADPASPPAIAAPSRELQDLGFRLFSALRDNPSLRKTAAQTLDEILQEAINAGSLGSKGGKPPIHKCPTCEQPVPQTTPKAGRK